MPLVWEPNILRYWVRSLLLDGCDKHPTRYTIDAAMIGNTIPTASKKKAWKFIYTQRVYALITVTVAVSVMAVVIVAITEHSPSLDRYHCWAFAIFTRPLPFPLVLALLSVAEAYQNTQQLDNGIAFLPRISKKKKKLMISGNEEWNIRLICCYIKTSFW